MINYTNLKKIIVQIILGILTWVIPIIVFLNFNNYYYKRFDQLNIYAKVNTTVDKETFNNDFADMMGYINSRQSKQTLNHFPDKDLRHLYDVKNLVTGLYVLTIFSIIIILISKELIIKNSALFLKTISGYNLLISSALIFPTTFNFTDIFLIFHKLSFRNNYWLLNEQTSYLIKFFPEQIFFEIGTLTIIFVIIISIIGLITWKLKTRRY